MKRYILPDPIEPPTDKDLACFTPPVGWCIIGFVFTVFTVFGYVFSCNF